MKHHTKKRIKHHVQRVTHVAKKVLFVWEIIITIILSAILIPLFIQNKESFDFYTLLLLVSLGVYAIFYLIGGQFKEGFIKNYFRTSNLRLLLAMTMFAVAFLFHLASAALWDDVFLVMTAVLYAYFLQRVTFFLRVIGL